jgi:hypothetical protein
LPQPRDSTRGGLIGAAESFAGAFGAGGEGGHALRAVGDLGLSHAGGVESETESETEKVKEREKRIKES